MQGRVVIGIACLLSGVGVFSEIAAGADNQLATAVAQFFETGWNPQTAREEPLTADFERIEQLAPGDRRIAYAFALIELKNRRYSQAARLLDDALSTDKDDLAARRAKVWLLMLTRKYPAALVEMELLAKSLPPPNAGGRDEDTYREMAAFLGRMFAFLEGPMSGAVVEHVLADSRDRVTARLNPQRRAIFDAANRELIRRFATLDLDRENRQDQAKASEQRDLDRVHDGIDRERRRLTDERKTLDARSDKLRADLKSDLAAIDAELQPLDARLARLETSANSLARSIRAAQAQIALLLFQADHSPDPNDQADLRSQAAQFEADAARNDADLRSVRAEASTVAGRRRDLIADRHIVLDQNRSQFESINRRTAEIAVSDRHLATDLKRVPVDAMGNTSKVRALAAQASALTTYEAFPFDSERQRLLDSFSK